MWTCLCQIYVPTTSLYKYTQTHTDFELLIRLEKNKPKSGCPDLQMQHWCCVVLCGAM